MPGSKCAEEEQADGGDVAAAVAQEDQEGESALETGGGDDALKEGGLCAVGDSLKNSAEMGRDETLDEGR